MNNKQRMIEYHLKNKEKESEYRKNNKDKINQRRKIWRLQNKPKELIYKHKYYNNNRESILQYAKEYSKKPGIALKRKDYMKNYRLINQEKLSESSKKYKKKYYLKNKKELLKLNKIHYYKNRAKKIKYQIIYNRKYRKDRYKIYPQYNISCRLRSLFHTALNRYASGKKMNSSEYGIDYNKIIKHLNPFPEKLHLYHIDHIRPLCSFNLNDIKEIQKAFSPENHQWLLAKDNLKKGAKYER